MSCNEQLPTPRLPPDLFTAYCKVRKSLKFDFSVTIGFQNAFTGNHGDWIYIWLAQGYQAPFQREGLEIKMVELSEAEIKAQVDGWSCRRICDASIQRWKDINMSGTFSDQAYMNSVRKVSEQFQSALQQARALDGWFCEGDDSMPKTKAICVLMRKWKYQELCFLREEIQCRLWLPFNHLLERWFYGQLAWQSWWKTNRKASLIISKHYDGMWEMRNIC
jgi:hypothetical protein